MGYDIRDFCNSVFVVLSVVLDFVFDVGNVSGGNNFIDLNCCVCYCECKNK